MAEHTSLIFPWWMGSWRKPARSPASSTEQVALWMMQRGYATGHGDTVEDLLFELEWQAKERGVKSCA